MNQVKKIAVNSSDIRADFPILNQKIHRDKPLIYLDSGASTQRPQSVIQSMVDCYQSTYANVHRGIHYLSEQSSAQYEEARTKLARFIGAEFDNEVIFTSGTTHSVNLVAHAWGDQHVAEGDEILLTIMEHHSNIVPWQQLAERKGAKIRWAGITESGQLDFDDFKNKLNPRTKVVACCAVSNVLGTINDVSAIVDAAHAEGAVVFLDAAQHVPHDVTDVQKWDVDFMTFSGHKMLGPTGIGVLYGKQAILESMPAFMGGGSMISAVATDGYQLGELPAKFEAGTPPIAQAIGLGAALEYLKQFEMSQIMDHEQELAAATINGLVSIDGLTILGPAADSRAGIVSFVVEGLSTQDISIFLDRKGVAIRAGHHCAMPLHEHLGIRNSCRASFYLYNTIEDVEYFCDAMSQVVAKLR